MPEVTIDQVKTITDIDVKRLYVPSVLRTTCPKCGDKKVVDFQSDYLSYPPANRPFDHYLCCYECDEEWSVRLKLTMQLEVVE